MKKNTIGTIKSAKLYDDFNINVEDWRTCYIEHCDINGITPEEETPMDFIYDILNEDWRDMLYSIDHTNYNEECVILGTLGLWNGKKDIEAVRESYLTEAIRKCAGKCDYVIVEVIDGHIEVTGIHHDGRNHFEIHILNKKGQNSINADLSKSCYHKKIKTDFWLSPEVF